MSLRKELSCWRLPRLPAGLGTGKAKCLEQVALSLRGRVGRAAEAESAAWRESLAGWLYDLVRLNVKRGRAFQLQQVLSSRQADCLGYASLLSALGESFGLELGIVEVLIDNGGRYVPHHVNILNLPDGSRRFLDLWYGSKDINHLRIGAVIDEEIKDADCVYLHRDTAVRGLPEYCTDAITFYVLGNRCLQQRKLDDALRYYTQAVELYPNNSRAFYNRALVREMMGDKQQAARDHARALKDEASVIRLLARVEEIQWLLELDQKDIPTQEQDICLLYSGFKTGQKLGPADIARVQGISERSVRQVLRRVTRRLGHSPEPSVL